MYFKSCFWRNFCWPLTSYYGEDFVEYNNYIPGAFATVGTGNEAKGSDIPHHHACFNVDEESLKVGAELYAQYALAYLNEDEF